MKSIKTVIFDFDYTLGDSTKGIVISINYALLKLGFVELETEQIKKTIGLSLKDTYYALTKDNNPENAALFSRFFKKKADDVMVDHTILYPDAKNVLSGLKEKGYKTAIVTTKYHYRIDQILNRYAAGEFIDSIIGAEDVTIEKPNPEGILRVMEGFGAAKADAIYIGDSLVDAMTAENAQVRFIAVLTGTTAKAEFQNHRYWGICKNLTDAFHCITALDR